MRQIEDMHAIEDVCILQLPDSEAMFRQGRTFYCTPYYTKKIRHTEVMHVIEDASILQMPDRRLIESTCDD
jgi:hypothetical protein